MTHKEAIYKFIEDMDIEMLDTFLDEGYGYCLRSKTHLIENLDAIFSFLKQKGDTKLTSQIHLSKSFPLIDVLTNEQTGDVEYHKFQGNKSRYYLALMFTIVKGRISGCDNASRINRKLGSIPVGKMQVLLFDEL